MEDKFIYNNIHCLPEFNIREIQWRSPVMKNIIAMLPKIAQTKSRVLIRGETGTGKTMVAKAIHNLSDFNHFSFFSIDSILFNRSNPNSELMENILINNSDDPYNGTLYFRDVDNLNLETQYKIFVKIQTWLREDRNYRIIASTKNNIRDKIDKGNFLEEFYYYLKVIYIYIPPLRERLEDLLPLTNYISKIVCKKLDHPIVKFGKSDVSKLYHLKLNGNMLEIASLVERTIALSSDNSKNSIISDTLLQDFQEEKEAETEGFKITIRGGDFLNYKENFIKKIVAEAIRKNDGKKKEAAKNLGISQRNLSYYITKYDISY